MLTTSRPENSCSARSRIERTSSGVCIISPSKGFVGASVLIGGLLSCVAANTTRRAASRRSLDVSVLAIPVLELLESGDHSDASECDLVGTRVITDIGGVTGAVSEIGEPLIACLEHVSDAGSGWSRDHIAGSHRRLILIEHEHAGAVEHHEQLLFDRGA